MTDDDFGDEDEIIVVRHHPRLRSVEDATFKWYTDGERVFPVGRSKGNSYSLMNSPLIDGSPWAQVAF